MIRKVNRGAILCAVALLLLTATACNKDFEQECLQSEPETAVTMEVENSSASVNSIAKKHYELIKTAIFATGSNKRTRTSDDESNPLVAKLKEMKIESENGDSISFYSLTPKQQEAFLSSWVEIESKSLSSKMEENPELTSAIELENEIVSEAIKEEGQTTRGNGITIPNPKSFFKTIINRLQKESEIRNKKQTRMGYIPQDTILFEDFRDLFCYHAKRGYFLVRLPNHYDPSYLLNIGDPYMKIGHSAIITINENSIKRLMYPDNGRQIFKYNLKKYTKISIGANFDGVDQEYALNWQCKAYIMGIQSVSYKFNLWRLSVTKTMKRVTNISKLADEAEKYQGAGYAFWQFLWPKLAAPYRFTCTSLVWYCAKQAYDIDISSWWQIMITPSALVESENTYIVGTIN